MSQGEGFLPNGQDVAYLWSRSAVYFDTIVACTPAELVFPGSAPSFSAMHLFTPHRHVPLWRRALFCPLKIYLSPSPFPAWPAAVSLFYVACYRSNEDPNTSSISEQKACAVLLKFLLQHGIDCASLTHTTSSLQNLFLPRPKLPHKSVSLQSMPLRQRMGYCTSLASWMENGSFL